MHAVNILRFITIALILVAAGCNSSGTSIGHDAGKSVDQPIADVVLLGDGPKNGVASDGEKPGDNPSGRDGSTSADTKTIAADVPSESRTSKDDGSSKTDGSSDFYTPNDSSKDNPRDLTDSLLADLGPMVPDVPGREIGPDSAALPPDVLPNTDTASQPDASGLSYVTLAVGGDFAEKGRTTFSRSVATLISNHDPPVTSLVYVGDTARYLGEGKLLDFITKYYASPTESNMGQFDSMVFPQLGNHEYLERNAQGYFDYFTTRMKAVVALSTYHGSIDTVGRGWYSVDVNGWHIVSLNSNCSDISGGCSSGGAQDQWLSGDLTQHAGMPTFAVWHAPLWTCTLDGHARATEMQNFWSRLYDARADFVFNGHNHLFQRYKPLGKATSATEDPEGITEILTGSSGSATYKPCSASADTHVAKTMGGDESIGMLFLTLGSDGSYSWEYRLASDGSVFDSASGKSHNAR